MTWISPHVGWIAGGVTQGDLFATRDGGLTWKKQTPPVPNKTNDAFGRAAPPRFSDLQHGTFVVTFSGLKVDESRSLIAVYRTSDSGKTWLRSLLREVPLDVSVGVADDGSPIWAHLDKGTLSTAGPSSSNSVSDPSSIYVRSGLGVIGFSFINANTGLLLVHGNDCSVVKTFCPDIWRLLFTKDAGTNVRDVTPSQYF